MSNTNTLIGIQNAYIAKLKAIRSKPRRTNAMLTANASRAAFEAILALGFSHDQANKAMNDATDVYFLEVNARPSDSLHDQFASSIVAGEETAETVQRKRNRVVGA